jgi:hypothetical protein
MPNDPKTKYGTKEADAIAKLAGENIKKRLKVVNGDKKK